jgi:hypothetical protein
MSLIAGRLCRMSRFYCYKCVTAISVIRDKMYTANGSHFWDGAEELTEADKGIIFERLTQLYLETVSEYRTKLRHVWLLRDVPADIRRQLNLPGSRDEGIDLIARTRQGKC